MTKHFIVYKIVFLLVANMLYSDIHHSHEDSDHNHENNCIECLYNESDSNYIFDSVKVDFFYVSYSILINNAIECKICSKNRIFQSRAPPIS